MASRPLLMLLASLAIGTPLGGGAFEGPPPRLTRCPSGDLTLTVPADLPAGSVLFTWDPALVTVKSRLEAYKHAVTKTLSRASPSARARAFFVDQPGLQDTWTLGDSRAVLTRALPDGPEIVPGRFPLTCFPASPDSRPPSRSMSAPFRVHLRLVRSGSTTPTRPAAAPVAQTGSLWRSPVSRFRATAAGADAVAALAGAQLCIRLAPLLLPARPARIRLLDSSDPRRVRLLASADGSPPSLLLSLAPGDSGPLSVGLEAADAAGRTDVTTLLVSAGHLLPEPPFPPGGPARRTRMGWWLPVMVSAAALLAAGLLACALACACARCRRARDAACVKPEFV